MSMQKLHCKYCTKEVQGKANIAYTLNNGLVDDIIVLHDDCVKSYDLQKKNLIHKCPKCNGRGHETSDTLNLWTREDGSLELVWSSQMYRYHSRYNNGKFEKIKDRNKQCSLCDGEGYLAKEPIPVITEWRKG
jgi:hypothetical protein